MQIVKVEQGSPEWIAARIRIVTASRVADVISKIKSGESAGRRNYRAEIIVERLTGVSQENGYVSADMQRGIDLEPFARAAYEIAQDCSVDRVGLVLHPTIPNFGASPDGMIGEDGLLELKCPKAATHLDYVLGKVAPAEYQAQMLSQMACSGRAWVDFASYHPDFPPHLQLFVVRFPRDDKRIEEIEKEVVKFNAEVDEVIAKLPKAPTVEDSLYLSEKDIEL